MDKKKEKIKAAVNIVAGMPASQIRKNMPGLQAMLGNLSDTVMLKLDLPHHVSLDPTTGQGYIQTEMNRNGSSYRSPISNAYIPEVMKEVYYPSLALREFQEKANNLFQEYTRLYYQNGVGSFFVKQNEDGLNCGFFARKSNKIDYVALNDDDGMSGSWDTFNTIDVKIDMSNTTKAQSVKKAIYKLSTTVLFELTTKNAQNPFGTVSFSGQLKKNKEQTHKITQQRFLDDFHIANIGRMIQDMETYMRQNVEVVQMGKIRAVMAATRYENTKKGEDVRVGLASQLAKMKATLQQYQQKDCVILK